MSLAPHQPRAIRFLELWEFDGWAVKLYGIRAGAAVPETRFLERAREIARQTLPAPAVTPQRYGVAFVTVHQADAFNQIIVDWWARANELRHHVFKAEAEEPDAFVDITASGEAFCVWELRVIGFERDAWLASVLANPSGPDLPGYLARRLSEDA